MTDTDVSQGRESGAGERKRPGFFGRLALFVRQVIVELRKVIWPTRKELIAYTTVVIVFVVLMGAVIAGFDYVFTNVVLFVFG